MQYINWLEVFKIICNRDKGSLKWGLPEPWIHAELFSALEKISNLKNWIPFPDEVPYITYYPVQLPKITNRNWKKDGAIKYIDICFKSEDDKEWCWFEFKVRNTSYHNNQYKANLESRDAYKKDIVALIGFDYDLTADTWDKPDPYTKSYKYELLLREVSEKLRKGKHNFISCYFHLEKKLDEKVWNEKNLREQIFNYFLYKNKQSLKKITFPDIKIEYHINFFKGKHSLIICSW